MQEMLEARTWLARVLGHNGEIVGTAFAIDTEHIVTCAHVVRDAGASGPGDAVALDFPTLDQRSDAEVLAEGWLPPQGTAGDIALLRLRDPPAGMQAAPLRSLRSLDGLRFTSYGFPAGYPGGIHVEGVAGKAVEREWVQLDIDSTKGVEPGYSGAAVWSDELGRVVALITTRAIETRDRVGFAIPLAAIAPRSTIISEALPTPLDLDPARTTHWGPRSRGVESDRDDAGWLFSGRRVALAELVDWLTAIGPPPMRVVTGAPGSGKSAVVARLVTTSDRHYRARLPEFASADPTVPPAGVFDATFYAGGRTVRDFVRHVAEICELAAETPAELLDALDRAGRHLVLAIDAVDEAIEPKELCWLLNDLTDRGSRALIGCREHLTRLLGDPVPIRLDQQPYLQDADIERYVAELFARRAPTRQRDWVPREIAAAAAGNFLVAQLTAQAIALGGEIERPFPRRVSVAFERLLDALPNSDTTRELLLPLAYSFGDGLPDGLWLEAVAVLSRPYRPGDLAVLLQGPAASFLTSSHDSLGSSRHRLFHQALAETLTAGRDPAEDQLRLWRAWTSELPPSVYGRARWADADGYLLRHAAEHAAQADTLAGLAADADYLLSGELTRLVTQLNRSALLASSEAAVLLRLVASRAQPLDREHRATLLALAALHLGLEPRAEELVADARPRSRPRWAHFLGPPHQILSGHDDTVQAVAIGRIGERDVIVSGGHDNTVRLWDATSGEPIGKPLTGHTDWVNAVAIGRAGERDVIASGGHDNTVRLWDATSGEPIGEPLGHSTTVNAVAIGSAGERDVIVSGDYDNTVRLWDATSGRLIGRPLTGHAATAVAIGRAGERDVIAAGGFGRTLRLWDATSGEPIREWPSGHSSWVEAVAIGRAGERDVIASCGQDSTVRLWDATSGEPIGEPLTGHTFPVQTVAIGRAGERDVIASGAVDRTVRLWDAPSGEPIGKPLRGHTRPVSAIAVGRAGERDIIASAAEDDHAVYRWDAASGEPIGKPLRGHTRPVSAIAVGRAGERDIIASGGSADHVHHDALHLWDAVSGEPIGNPLTGSEVQTVAIGRIEGIDVVASGGVDHKVHLWNAVSRELIGEPIGNHAPYSVTAVAIGRAGERDVIASTGGHDNTVRLWDATSGEPIGKPLTGHTDRVTGLAIGRAGERDIVVSAAVDRTVRLWDATSGEPIGEPLTGHPGWVTGVAIGRAGERDLIVSGGYDNTVRLWDAQARTPVDTIQTVGPVHALAIGATGDLYCAGGVAVWSFVM